MEYVDFVTVIVVLQDVAEQSTIQDKLSWLAFSICNIIFDRLLNQYNLKMSTNLLS